MLNRKQLKASSSHVAIVGHITPQEFRLRLAEADMTGGTYNRYLPVFVERSRRLPIPQGVDDHTVAALSAQLDDSIARAREIRQVQLGGDATRLWTVDLYDELTESDGERAEAEFTRRAAPYCLRVGGLLAVLDGRALMSLADLTAAAALIRYSIASARYVLDRQARDPRLDRIRRAIDAAGEAGLSRSAVSGLFSRNLTKEVLDELLAQLTAVGAYEEARQPTRGRPAETYGELFLLLSYLRSRHHDPCTAGAGRPVQHGKLAHHTEKAIIAFDDDGHPLVIDDDGKRGQDPGPRRRLCQLRRDDRGPAPSTGRTAPGWRVAGGVHARRRHQMVRAAQWLNWPVKGGGSCR